MPQAIQIIGIEGIPEVRASDDLAALIVDAAKRQKLAIQDGDILTVTQKVVSKAEGQLVDLSTVSPSTLAEQWAREYQRDPRLIEVALRESRRISRSVRRFLTSAHHISWRFLKSRISSTCDPMLPKAPVSRIFILELQMDAAHPSIAT